MIRVLLAVSFLLGTSISCASKAYVHDHEMADIQYYLSKLGYYEGNQAGIRGPSSYRSIGNFLKDYGLEKPKNNGLLLNQLRKAYFAQIHPQRRESIPEPALPPVPLERIVTLQLPPDMVYGCMDSLRLLQRESQDSLRMAVELREQRASYKISQGHSSKVHHLEPFEESLEDFYLHLEGLQRIHEKVQMSCSQLIHPGVEQARYPEPPVKRQINPAGRLPHHH